MPKITTKIAAERLGVTPGRIRALISAGKLPAERIGRDWLIEERHLSKVAVRKPGRPSKGAH